MFPDTFHAISLNRPRPCVSMPGVVIGAGAVVGNPRRVARGANSGNTPVADVGPASFRIPDSVAEQGRLFDNVEMRFASGVAAIGGPAAQSWFDTSDPIGLTICIRNRPVEVKGVLVDRGSHPGRGDRGQAVLIPITTARQEAIRPPSPGTIHYRVAQARRAERTQGKINDATQTRHIRHRIRDESEVDFAVRDLASIAAVAKGIATALTLSLGAIGSVSLPVGGASAS